MSRPRFPHLRLLRDPEVKAYQPPPRPIDKPRPIINREQHGQYLLQAFNSAWNKARDQRDSGSGGTYLSFALHNTASNELKSLENFKNEIRICNVRESTATVFIPDTGKKILYTKFQNYLDPAKDKNRPCNADLMEVITAIDVSVLRSFFVDGYEELTDKEKHWCEVWLRGDSDSLNSQFDQLTKKLGLSTKNGYLRFPERLVKIIYASQKQLLEILLACDHIAEFRIARPVTAFYLDLPPREQGQWVDDLLKRTTTAPTSAPAICILDTGVNHGHQLLKPVLTANDCQTVVSSWGTHDQIGHGTQMAGLAAYGNFEEHLGSKSTVELNHCLESVKIFKGGSAETEFWGDITSQAVSLAEIQNPNRQRIFCLAVTSPDITARGVPTSWSATIDQLAFGNHQNPYLFLIAAGNATSFVSLAELLDYPHKLRQLPIHNPAQAWNALTIGAYTAKNSIQERKYLGYEPVAQPNELSPYSTTSCSWDKDWPLKPDVVFEGGNFAANSSGDCAQCNDLALLSTFHRPDSNLFSDFRATSAATAQAAHFAACIMAQYPNYWPETVRALIVHSANWPDAMKKQFHIKNTKGELAELIRTCGFGVPDLDEALYCAKNSLTLIIEKSIQPFKYAGKLKRSNKGKNPPKQMHLYNLPWPTSELERLGDEPVLLKVTLSYFVEPSPGARGWTGRYRYPSHLLRFEINSPGEDEAQFAKRINKIERDEDYTKSVSASNYWKLGSKNRVKGSIHSDVWEGSALDLASSNLIAVFPANGWWKDHTALKKSGSEARYSLIVSIKTKSQAEDIYTTVKSLIQTETETIISV